VDARHRNNICKLLFEEFRDKQLIITTHDEIWYEQLCASQRAYGLDGTFVNLTIINWSVEGGLVIRPYKLRWDVIQEKVANGDKTGAGSDGRTYLEWLLKRICEITNAPVPVNNWQSGMVADLINPPRRRIEELVKDEPFRNRVSVAFTELERTKILGNILSHDNELAGGVLIDEVKSFCECVYQLHQLFLCPNCGCFINYYRDLNILRCSNGKCNSPFEVKTK